jgi:predicted dehydrogenase
VSSLRWGVLSTAKIAREKVIPAIKAADRCELIGIASRVKDRAERVSHELSIPQTYDTYEALLAADEIDAVYNPLPNHMHAEWTMAAARAGKHVLCEKPMGLSAAEAQKMVDVCATEGVRLMEAFMYRMHPSWIAVCELVGSGRIGRLSAVQSWFSYFNNDPTDIRNIDEVGGGALLDIGCYCVNLSRMLFDAEPTRVESSMRRDPAMGVDVLTSAILEFDSGVASFACSTRSERDQRVHIYGDEGWISIGIPFNIPPDLPTKIYVSSGGSPTNATTEQITFSPADQYEVQAELFADAVLDDKPVPIPPEDAVANMRILDEIREICK